MNKPKIIFSNFLQFTSIIDVKLSGTLSPQWDGSYNKFKKIRQPSYSSDWVSATSPKLKLENQAFEKNEELWHSIKNGNIEPGGKRGIYGNSRLPIYGNKK